MKRIDHAEGSSKFIKAKDHLDFHDKRLWDLRKKRDRESEHLPEWEELRSLASAIKEHTLTHLADYLEQFERNAIANGAIVHWARDAAEHNQIVVDIMFKAGGYFNEMPHDFSTNAITPYSGVGSGLLQTTFPQINPANWGSFNLGYERKDAGGYFEWQKESPWYFRVDGNQVKFDGTKVGSAALGTSPGNGYMDLRTSTFAILCPPAKLFSEDR